jgi:PKD repeat protein
MQKIFTTFLFLIAFLGAKSQCDELIISEYIEGSSNNKVIELYNPTAFSVPLATLGYQIRVYNNGSATPTSTINLTGSIAANGTYILCHTSSAAPILAIADQTSGSLSHNGNDAIQLFRTFDAASIDVVGVIGVDPGTEWLVNGSSGTLNHTLVRKSTIQSPNLTWTGSGEMEWDIYAQDDFTHLDAHNNGCVASPLNAEFTFADHCFGTSATFTSTTTGGDGNYTYAWDFGDASGTSMQQNPTYSYATAGTYTVTLTVTDGALATDVATHSVIVFDKPVITSVPDNTSGCSPLQVCYTTNISGGTGPYTFFWSSGNTIQNPCITYSNSNNELLIVTDGNGCSDSVTNSITIIPIDDASFTYPSTSMCINDAGVLPTITGLAGGTFTGNGITNASTGFFDPAVSGQGCSTISYTTNGICPNTGIFTICVSTILDATIDPAGPFCELGVPTNLTAADNGGVWSGNGIIDANLGTFDASAAGVGTHTITYTISGSCGDTDTETIEVLANASVNIYNSDTAICNDSFGFFLSAEAGGTWSGTFVTDNADGTGFFSSAAITPGTYTATYTISGQCGDAGSIQITVTGPPVADYSFTSNLGTVNFTSTSTGAVTFSWDYDDGSPLGTIANPSHNFTANGTYNVCLTVTSAESCESVYCENIVITGLGIKEISSVKMNVYPNPSNGNFTVESNSIITKISVKNIIGQNVFTKNINAINSVISLEDVNNGFYFIELETENGKAVKRIEITN